jgi:prepilin-type N-terminal cleavage/methylation domain-containing protein
MCRRQRTQAFTLVELLVVIAIIGILVSLLLPAVNSARDAARRVQCTNNQKQLALGILNFESARRVLPPSYVRKGLNAELYGFDGSLWTSNNGHGLLTLVLPYVEEAALHDLIDFTYDWLERRRPSVANANWFKGQTDIPFMLCPNSPPRPNPGLTDYAVCGQVTTSVAGTLVQRRIVSPRSDWSGMLHPFRGEEDDRDYFKIRIRHIKDGMSKTIMLCEDAGRPNYYINGVEQSRNDITGSRWSDDDGEFWIHDICGQSQMMNCHNNNEIYSFHVGGCIFSFGDGTVRFISESVDPDVFITALTRFAGDVSSDTL